MSMPKSAISKLPKRIIRGTGMLGRKLNKGEIVKVDGERCLVESMVFSGNPRWLKIKLTLRKLI